VVRGCSHHDPLSSLMPRRVRSSWTRGWCSPRTEWDKRVCEWGTKAIHTLQKVRRAYTHRLVIPTQHTSLKVQDTARHLLSTIGRLMTSRPDWKSTNVGSCLARGEVLTLYLQRRAEIGGPFSSNF
jgi:hypothetical protein